jgi:hypothetical protein
MEPLLLSLALLTGAVLTDDGDLRVLDLGTLPQPQSLEGVVSRLLSPARVEVRGRALVVYGDEAVLEAVRALVSALRGMPLREARVEVALVPTAALDAAAPGWNGPGAMPGLEPGVIERALVAAGKDAWFASGLSRRGQPLAIRPEARARRLAGHEVNQTGIMPYPSPEVREAPEGLSVELLAFPSPGGAWYRVDARVARSRTVAVEKRRLYLGDVELPSESREEIRITALVPAGRTAVLGTLSDRPEPGAAATEAPRDFSCLLRIRPIAPPAGEPAAGPAILDASMLLHPLPYVPAFAEERRLLPRDPTAAPDPGLIESGRIMDALLEAIPPEELSRSRPEEWDEAFVLATQGPPAAAALGSLERFARERAVAVTLDLWEAGVAAADLDGATAFVEPGLLERFGRAPGRRVRLASVSGARFSLDAVLSQAYLKDLEMVSGGTGYVSLQLARPVIEKATEGMRIRGRIEALPEGRVLIALEGEAAGAARLGRKGRVRIDQAPGTREGLPQGEGGDVRSPPRAEAGAAVWQEIDLPEVPRWSFKVDLQVPAGKPVLLRAAPDPEKPGVTRALIGLVNVFPMEKR